MASAGLKRPMSYGFPASSMLPLPEVAPNNRYGTSSHPIPSSPVMPTISPLPTVRSRSRTWFPLTPVACSTGAPVAAGRCSG